MQWRLASSRQLLVRSWDGECVVYDCAAGDTHLLGADAAAVLMQLQDGPCAQGALDQAIASELAALGLLERAV
jgi:PqqD family protein of HPr-rel-A system